MVQPETDEERKVRLLKELEGKNIAHGSVMLSAYITSRLEVNKAIFTFSSAAIGLLVIVFKNPLSGTGIASGFYILTMILFVAAIVSTLLVYASNANLIESYIKGEREKKEKYRLKLKKMIDINYFTFGLGIVSAAILAMLQ